MFKVIRSLGSSRPEIEIWQIFDHYSEHKHLKRRLIAKLLLFFWEIVVADVGILTGSSRQQCLRMCSTNLAKILTSAVFKLQCITISTFSRFYLKCQVHLTVDRRYLIDASVLRVSANEVINIQMPFTL